MEVLLVNLQQSRNNIVQVYVSNIQMSQTSNNETDIHILPQTTLSMLGVTVCAITTLFSLFNTTFSTN